MLKYILISVGLLIALFFCIGYVFFIEFISPEQPEHSERVETRYIVSHAFYFVGCVMVVILGIILRLCD